MHCGGALVEFLIRLVGALLEETNDERIAAQRRYIVSCRDDARRTPRSRESAQVLPVVVSPPDGEQVSRLTLEGVAERGECGEPDGSCSAVLEHGEIDWGDADLVRQVLEQHAAFGQQLVEVADHAVVVASSVDRGSHTRPSVSRLSSAP